MMDPLTILSWLSVAQRVAFTVNGIVHEFNTEHIDKEAMIKALKKADADGFPDFDFGGVDKKDDNLTS